MSDADSTVWLHINQRCGGGCIYCQLKEAKARIKELEQLEESNGELRREMDAQLAKLEKVAEATERYFTVGSYINYERILKALRAAGYLNQEK